MPTLNLGRVRFNWKGAYAPATPYVEYDVVEDDGQSYVCIAPVTGTGPNEAGGDTYWADMLVRSADYNQARQDAIDAAAAAGDSQTAAAGSATASSDSATAAGASEALADQWANEAEDVEVETGKYSAFHYMQKAAAFGDPNQFDITADQTADTRTTAEWMSALLVAQQKANDNQAELVTRSRKNLLINGGFDIWQRGESKEFNGSNGHGYLADRWTFAVTPGTGASLLVSKSTLNNNPSAKIDVTTAGTDFTLSEFVRGYYVKPEDYDVDHLNGKSVTLSFIIDVNWSGNLPVSIVTTHATSRSYVTDIPVTAGIQTVKVTIPFEVDTVQAATGELGFQINIGFCNEGAFVTTTPDVWDQANGYFCTDLSTNWAKTLGNYLNVTNVQLEEGDTATDFEQRPIGEELALCQRYYFKTFANNYNSYPLCVRKTDTQNVYQGMGTFATKMRTSPSMTISSPDAEPIHKIGSSYGTGTFTCSAINTSDFIVEISPDTDTTSANVVVVSNRTLTADAEL